MKFLLLGLFCVTASASNQPAAGFDFSQPWQEATLVGVCYAAPDCAGGELKKSVTRQYCVSLGGSSIKYTTSCVTF